MSGRYDRQTTLPEIGPEGQLALTQASVLIVGLGGLGCPVVSYLSAAGVGQLILNDFDRVELSNLARQPLYRECDVGRSKAAVASEWVQANNPSVSVDALSQRLDQQQLETLVGQVNLVVDASDNIATRLRLGQVCHSLRRPLVFGAAIRWEGQYSVFRYDLSDRPGIADLLSEADEELGECSGSGVFGPVVGVIGAAMAGEAIKLLLGQGDQSGRLRLFDARLGWQEIAL